MNSNLNDEVVAIITEQMKNNSFIAQLFDKTNDKVSMTNVFVTLTTIVAIILLCVPIIAIGVDLWFNHSVTMSWSDIASYIGAVVSLFATAGLTKAWSNYSDAKVTIATSNNSNNYNNDIENEEILPIDTTINEDCSGE